MQSNTKNEPLWRTYSSPNHPEFGHFCIKILQEKANKFTEIYNAYAGPFHCSLKPFTGISSSALTIDDFWDKKGKKVLEVVLPLADTGDLSSAILKGRSTLI